MRKPRTLLLIALLPLLLSACAGSPLGNEPGYDFQEQLYVDARLNFAIKHPLQWRRQQLPVSALEYRGDSVSWQIPEPETQQPGFGQMRIRGIPADPDRTLHELLGANLREPPEQNLNQAESFIHPLGEGLKLLTEVGDQGRLTIALKGVKQDFIIAFDFPSDHSDRLLPVFQEILGSFVEIVAEPVTK
jgi:hypothetical protein